MANRRRDGSQASKAKSNKTIDYQTVYMNQQDPVFRMNASFDPSYQIQSMIPPLMQYERTITQMPAVLTKFVNRRRCDDKQSMNRQDSTEVTFAKYNPDGRFLFVGSHLGIIYVYNSYDFSFHYQYLVQAQQRNILTCMTFLPNNSSACYIGNKNGQIHFYPNILHYDISMKPQQLTIGQSEIHAVSASSCGTKLVSGLANGQTITMNTYRVQEEGRTTLNLFDVDCNDVAYHPHGSQIYLAAGNRLCLVDQRIGGKDSIVSRAQYKRHQDDQIRRVAIHPGGSLVAAAGSDGCRIFDLRMLGGSDSYHCLYQVRPHGEIAEGMAVQWHPIYSDVLVVGDKIGGINFYDLKYSTAGYGMEGLFEEQPVERFWEQATQRPFVHEQQQQQAYLHSIGYVLSAHKTGKGISQPLLDLDIHPSGNQMASTGQDKDVRFWTYPGAGSLYNDCFHHDIAKGDAIDPGIEIYQFNQSHKDLQREQKELNDKIHEIEKKPCNEGEDIFTREEVQRDMKTYVTTADDHLREDEEVNYIREREITGRHI